MNKQFIIGATIVIFSIMFIFLPFLSPHSESITPGILPSSISIETDENISIWKDITCTRPLEISFKELNKIDPIIFYVRNDREYDVIATWEDNIYGGMQSFMKFFDEKNETWWLWPEFISKGPNYMIYIKSGQVLKVRYELGTFRPMRFSFWGMKDPEIERLQSRHTGVQRTSPSEYPPAYIVSSGFKSRNLINAP